MSLDEMPGRSVLDSTGRVIGHVAKAVVDLETWAVCSLRVRLRRDAAFDLDLPTSFLKPATLDVPTGLIHAASDAVILRAQLAELQGLSGYRLANHITTETPMLVPPA
jgi:sporulation protein YlmC with PRC-barrel domain